MSKRKRDHVVIIIPQDVLIEEILEKLPVKSLLRFKSVSKLWRREIESRRFQEKHLRHEQKTRDRNVLLVDCIEGYLRTLSLEGKSFSLDNHTQYPLHHSESCESSIIKLTHSCDGLTCLYSKNFMYVINPATRWYRKLPETRFQRYLRENGDRFPFPFLAFGKDSVTGVYKVVWLYNSHYLNLEGQTNTCEVFSFDDNTWRHDVIVSSPYPIRHSKDSTYAHGSLHWLIDAVTETHILSLDLHTETFSVMKETPAAFAPSYRVTMCNLHNRLCLSVDKGVTQTIWSLNQKDKSWDKLYSINLRSTLDFVDDEDLFSTPPVAALLNNRLLLYDFCDGKPKLVLHDLRFNTFTFFSCYPLNSNAISFSQSLITLP